MRAGSVWRLHTQLQNAVETCRCKNGEANADEDLAAVGKQCSRKRD
jgi:hypothetical protein